MEITNEERDNRAIGNVFVEYDNLIEYDYNRNIILNYVPSK